MSLKGNLIANFAGSAWAALMGLAFVPFYIKLLGAESYGIVGVFASLIGMLAVLDLGLSQAMNREMARLAGQAGTARAMGDTARTIEYVYWGVALAVGLGVASLSGLIAYHWLNPAQLSRADLRQALWIMALVIALRWPVALYTGGLNGLQKQGQVNLLLGISATAQGLGALAVLWFVSPTVNAFFWWQAVVALLQVFALRLMLWRNLPPAPRARFDRAILREIWRFAAGMSAISLLATVLMQVDKVILSKLLPLAEFGYYMFATAVAGALFRLVAPIFTAYYPRMTALVAADDRVALVRTYHQACQLMAVVTLPAAFALAFFATDILQLWTHNDSVVSNAAQLVSLFAIGNALNALMNMPYALQLAYGWTRLAFYANVAAVALLAPAIYLATLRWGSSGAAFVWILLNLCYIAVLIQVMHKYYLTGEKFKWYRDDLFKPLLAAGLVCFAGSRLMPADAAPLLRIAIMLGTGVLAVLATLLSCGALRGHPALRAALGARA